jgi:choloylglycine hydrolase
VEMPFDGMNDQGLAVGMAAVPTDEQHIDQNKQSIDSLVFIREILDHAQNVDEAIAIIEKYNILWGNGPPLHYLIADRKGNSVLVEYYQGKLNLIRNVNHWHVATNFLVTPVEAEPSGICDRYDRVEKKMDDSGGVLTNQEGLDLLHSVKQPITQWSVLYGMTSGEIRITMGSDSNANPIIFQLK